MANSGRIHSMEIADDDGDKLEIGESLTFPRTAVVFVTDIHSADTCGVLLNVESATKLQKWLGEFIKRHST